MKEIFTALITPFNQDQSIDYAGLYRLMDHLIEQGNKSFLLCGTTGETSTLKLDERRLLVENILKKYPYIRVMIGICSNSTAQVIRHIQMYHDHPSIYAFLIIVPYYIKPNQKGIQRHFDLIASSTKQKLMIYNIPSRCGANIEADTVIELAKRHKNIIGMKQCGSLEDMSAIKEALPAFKVYSGDDHMLMESLQHRADGIISVVSHVDYPLIDKICQKPQNFDDDYLKLLSRYVFIEPSPAPLKYILSQLGYIQNILRAPLCPINEVSQQQLQPFIEKYRKMI